MGLFQNQPDKRGQGPWEGSSQKESSFKESKTQSRIEKNPTSSSEEESGPRIQGHINFEDIKK